MDFSFENKRPPQKGFVLVADPFSNNDFFSRSVIYLCEHNEEGTFGFVLNNFVDLNLPNIAKNFPSIDTEISIGGPVQTDNIFFIHTVGNLVPGSVKVTEHISMGGDYDHLTKLIEEGSISPHQVRFFLGYSGWSAGQLEEEIQHNSWIVAPVLSPLEIMDFSVSDLWHRFMKREGKKYDILSKAPITFYDN